VAHEGTREDKNRKNGPSGRGRFLMSTRLCTGISAQLRHNREGYRNRTVVEFEEPPLSLLPIIHGRDGGASQLPRAS
jgi:hypothetical protein